MRIRYSNAGGIDRNQTRVEFKANEPNGKHYILGTDEDDDDDDDDDNVVARTRSFAPPTAQWNSTNSLGFTWTTTDEIKIILTETRCAFNFFLFQWND